MTGVSLRDRAGGASPLSRFASQPKALIANAVLRDRLVRKSALLMKRHSEMAALDAPPLDRLGYMRPYQIACEAIYRRLAEIKL